MYLKKIITPLLLLVLANANPITNEPNRTAFLNVASPRESFFSNLTSTLEKCQKIKLINSLYYVPEKVIHLPGVPADMSVHWDSGDVYFTLITERMKMRLSILHRSSGNIDFIKVPGVGQTSTIDNARNIVYLGTDKGLYKYESGRLELYGAPTEDIMYIAAASDGAVYITTWPQNLVQRLSNHGRKIDPYDRVPNGHALTIDHRDNLYFVAGRTTYILKRGHSVPIKINGLPNNKTVGLFVSYKKDVFAMDDTSNIYSIDIDTATAKYLGTFKINNVNTFAVDTDDNVLIGTKGTIFVFYAYLKNPCLKLNQEMSKKDNH